MLLGTSGEPLLDKEEGESEDEEAVADRKLLCEEETTEVFLPRHAALSFLKTTRAGRKGRGGRGQNGLRGWDVMYS